MSKNYSISYSYKKLAFTLLFFSVSSFGASIALADSPTVTSFTSSSPFISYGHDVLLSWTIAAGSYGQELYVGCASGVTVKTSDGVVYPCNSHQTIGSTNETGSASLTILNVSGSTQLLRTRLIPKDSDGALNDAGAGELTLSVGTSPQPLTGFSYSTSTASTGSSITLTWTGHDIPGTNLQFDCVNGIRVTSISPSVSGDIPCGSPVYANDLPASGSATVQITNNLSSPALLSVRLLPSIVSGIYDGIHSLSLSVPILEKPSPLVLSVTRFVSSSARVASGDSVSFSWVSVNSAGVNFQFQCMNPVSIMGTEANATSTKQLPCNVPAFSNVLPSVGTTTISFVSQSTQWLPISVVLLPERADGTYDGTKSAQLSIVVTPPNQTTQTLPAAVPPVLPNNNQNTQPPSGTAKIKAVRVVTFSISLKKGSRGVQVSALQSFLSEDATLYPEKTASGYFGSLTELALKRFQERYGIAKNGDAGYGLVGPKTRGKLNTMEYF